MKRLLAVAFAAFALTSFGAWEKIGTVRLADVDSLVRGVTRLGEFTGNQMLGIMASQSVGQLPPVTFFGPGRSGVAMSFVLFMDGDKLTGDPTKAFESLEYAVLYPVSVTKAAFIAAHEGAVETNGLVRVCIASDDDDDDDDDDDEASADEGEENFVGFSADGKWAAWSDKPEQAKAALEETKMAEKKMDGDLAKLIVAPKGWTAVTRAIDKAAKSKDLKEKDRKQLAEYAALVRQITAWAAGVRVNELGLDVRFAGRCVAGSDISKVGQKAISPEVWKAVPLDAVGASVVAEDSGSKTYRWDDIVAVLKKHGIDLPFLTVAEPVPSHSVFTVDVQGLFDYVKAASNTLAKVDTKALMEDVAGLNVQPSVPLKGPACGASLVVKGFKPTADMKTRFETTLPEVADKPICTCCVISYYELLKGLAPTLLANAEPEERMMFEPMLASLPPAGKSGFSCATWREKDSWQGILRLGADEFKGVAACFSAITAMQMQKAMKAAQQMPKGAKAKSAKKPAKAK